MGDCLRCQGLNPSQSCARQVPFSLSYMVLAPEIWLLNFGLFKTQNSWVSCSASKFENPAPLDNYVFFTQNHHMIAQRKGGLQEADAFLEPNNIKQEPTHLALWSFPSPWANVSSHCAFLAAAGRQITFSGGTGGFNFTFLIFIFLK